MNKFHARKTECNQGHTHDSKKEANYCNDLELQRKAGVIDSYEVQPTYELQEAFTTIHGEKVRAITYRADFEVLHNDGTFEIIDTKGMRTAVFDLKWKMLKYTYRNCANNKFTIV